MKNLVIFLLLFFLSCFATKTSRKVSYGKKICNLPSLVYIDNSIENEYENHIISSIEYWNNVADQQLFVYGGQLDINLHTLPGEIDYFIFGYANEVIIEEWMTDFPFRVGLAVKSPSIACTSGGFILIKPELDKWKDKRKIETLFRHELGHMLGLHHTKYKDDVMYFRIHGEKHPLGIHKDAIEDFRKIYK